jgi:type I restriction enzyme S subunit
MSNATSHIDNKPSLRASHCVPALRFKEFEGKWQILKLMEVAKIARGKFTPRPRNNPIYYNGDIPFIQTSDVVNANGKIEVYTQTLNEKGLAVSKLFPAGTILITIAANIGHVGVLQIDMACPDSLIGITPNDETHNYFLNYYLATHQKKMDYLAPEGAQKNINIDFLNPYKVPSTSLPEQQKIASFLAAVDEKIQQLTKKKELLEDYKKGVMQQLFSGQLRFKDENGNPYPDWEEKLLEEICSNISYGMNAAATTYDGQNKYLRITDIDESSNDLNVDKLTSPNGTLEDKFRVKEGYLLFARTGASVGKSYLYRISDGILYFAGFLIRFHVKDAVPAFIYLQTQTSKYDKWVKVMSMRSGQPGINAEEYKTFEISFPCEEEQQKIASYVSGIDTKIESVNNQITQAQTFKKGLLQQLFV